MRFNSDTDNLWAKKQLEESPTLRSIAMSWKALDGCTRPCNRVNAEHAIRNIYKNQGFNPPKIKWWSSPIAMILAHDCQKMGITNAKAYYKDAVFSLSPELDKWLAEPVRERIVFGNPVKLTKCICKQSSDRASDCYFSNCKRKKKKLDWGLFQEFVTHTINARGLTRRNDGIAHLLRKMLCHALEDSWEIVDKRRHWHSSVKSAINHLLFPFDLAHTLLEWQVSAFVAGDPLEKNCVWPYIELAQNTHAALFCENVCWLSERPIVAEFDEEDKLHAERKPALVYADGTEIYSNKGVPLPAKYVRHPENITLDEIDGMPTSSFRRASLIDLYGIERYLKARGAIQIESGSLDENVEIPTSSSSEADLIYLYGIELYLMARNRKKVESSNNGALWELNAGANGLIRIFEFPEFDRVHKKQPAHEMSLGENEDVLSYMQIATIFRTLPNKITTLKQALKYSKRGDYDASLDVRVHKHLPEGFSIVL